jgi:hypothetical protein
VSRQEPQFALQTSGLSPLDATLAKKAPWTGQKAAPEPLQSVQIPLKCRSQYLMILSFLKGSTTYCAPVATAGLPNRETGHHLRRQGCIELRNWRSIQIEPRALLYWGKGHRPVKLRRIFTVSLTTLLLCVTSWAAACDLSCGFAPFQPDCHFSQPGARNSMLAGTKMDGVMEGMSMTPVGDGGAMNQQSLSVASLGMVGHAAIDAMGPCERQSCDLEAVPAARATHYLASLSNVASGFASTTQTVSGLQALFRNPQNENAGFGLHGRIPLSISLRV